MYYKLLQQIKELTKNEVFLKDFKEYLQKVEIENVKLESKYSLTFLNNINTHFDTNLLNFVKLLYNDNNKQYYSLVQEYFN